MTIELQINHNELAITIIIINVPHRIDVHVYYHNFPLLIEGGRASVGNLLWLLLSQPFIKSAIHSFIHSIMQFSSY